MEQIKQQIAALNRRLDKLSVSPSNSNRRNKRVRRRGRNNNAATPGTTGSVVANTMQGPRRRNRRKNGGSLGQGEIAMSRSELIRTVQVPAKQKTATDYVDLCPSSFTFLKSLYESFERIKFLKMHISFKSAVGTTQGGMVTYAIDWTLQASGKSRQALSGYTPNCSHPVWESPKQKLVLPQAKLQSRAWYVNNSEADAIDRCPARLLIAVDAAAGDTPLIVGEVWVDYHVIMSGTKA